MIIGVGIDLVGVPKMQRIISSAWASRFIARVFTPHEIEVCEKSASRAQSYAARFAAKEALVKALGTGFHRGVTPSMIQVRGRELSPPSIELSERALEVADARGVRKIHVSLTHIPETAAAVVILEG
jgi:holo-[acyl-carrier protein] synthase